MTRRPKHSLSLVTLGMFATVCNPAAASNKYDSLLTQNSYQIEQERAQAEQDRTTAQAAEAHATRNSHHDAQARDIAEMAILAAQDALRQAQETLQALEKEEQEIIDSSKSDVKASLKEAERELQEVEAELRRFNTTEFERDFKDLKHRLQQAVEENKISQEEVDQMISHMQEIHESALADARNALLEVRLSLEQLREEHKH
ncbi:hypothetical protein [Paremcibacter congregatus]|uniref:hypothetical protein n=1 Tax=Paremcibacter congregatus TaxID=2043170 RepID=UPI0030EC668E